jgi:iron complex outermembrane recepter protein
MLRMFAPNWRFSKRVSQSTPCALLPLLLAAPVFAQPAQIQSAQVRSSQVKGVVKDPDQSVIAHLVLKLTDLETGAVLTTTTDGAGNYSFAALPAGSYRLEAQGAGFKTYTNPAVVVAAGQSLTEDIALQLGGSNATVTVNGNLSGTPANGYHVDTVQQGVMGTTSVTNLPYQISILPSNEIQNTQARNLRDALKYLPLVSFQEQQGSEIIRPETRGIEGSVLQNTRMDGMAMAITGANALEQYDQIEVENGLGAAMYGPANPSGIFNFVLKRPTEERTANINLEYDSKSIGTIDGDFGGRFGPHKLFGYRSNLVFGEGTGFVDDSFLRRRLAEFAFDIRPTNATLVDVHYSVYDIVQRGYPGWFTYGPHGTSTATTPAPTLILPTAPNPTREGLDQSYLGVDLTTQSSSARLHHDFSPNWHAEAGGLWQRLDRHIDTQINALTDNSGDYTASEADTFAPRFETESDLGYITGDIDKWHIHQNVVIGSQGYNFITYSEGVLPKAAQVRLGTGNVHDPINYAPPAYGIWKNDDTYASSVVHQQGFNLGDLISFRKYFLVRLAASQDWIGVDNNNAQLTRVSGSNKNGISPSASVLFKPSTGTTFYATYASSLEQGDVAPAGTVNQYEALAPYRSKEWETGYKGQMGNLYLTSALFRIQRPFANTNYANYYEITGNQVNFGAEMSVQGEFFHRLTVDGGFTALNARLNDTGITATNGKRFVGTPSYHSNLLSEYRVPGVQNLVVTGDWLFTGRRPQDDQNLHYTPGYSTFDFGFRYTHTVLSKSTVWRFSSNNVTDTHYYSTILPGDITGTGAATNTALLGNPRTFQASMQVVF